MNGNVQLREKSLQNRALELDYELGGIDLRRETLNDIKIILGQLRVKMDNLQDKDIRTYYNELHTKIRLIEDLFNYTVTSLNEEYIKAESINHAIFDKVIKRS